MTDPMQRAVEVLARALPRVTMDASRESARALLAEIAPMIVQAERKTLVIQPDMSKVRAMLDSAEDRWRHITQIGATIRINAMRHGATDAEIEAFLTGEADFVDWMAGKLAEAPPDVSGLLEALREAERLRLACMGHVRDNGHFRGRSELLDWGDKCGERARTEMDAQKAGENLLEDYEIRSALTWELPERDWSKMTRQQQESALADQAVERMQKAALRISAYRISGSEGVQHYKAVNAFDDALRAYQNHMAAWRRL